MHRQGRDRGGAGVERLHLEAAHADGCMARQTQMIQPDGGGGLNLDDIYAVHEIANQGKNFVSRSRAAQVLWRV